MRCIALCLLCILTTIGAAHAEVSLLMKAWDYIPMVEISQGRAVSCDSNRIVWSGPMRKNETLPASRFPGAGPNGDDVCYRRSLDPLSTNSNLGPWTRCLDRGVCEIL